MVYMDKKIFLIILVVSLYFSFLGSVYAATTTIEPNSGTGITYTGRDNPPSLNGIEMTSEEYANASASDDNRVHLNGGANISDIPYFLFNFTTPSVTISQIDVSVEGSSEVGGLTYISIYNFTKSGWEDLGYGPDTPEHTDTYTSCNSVSSCSNFVLNNKISFEWYISQINAWIELDYAKLVVYYNTAPTFTSITPTNPTYPNTVSFSTVASDSDTGDTIKLYVCKSNDGTSSGCGAGGTWCSSSLVTSNPSCQISTVLGAGNNNYYAYIFDNNNEGASANPKSGTFTINQATLIMSISGTNVTYGTAVNTTPSESNSGDDNVNYTLWRNNTLVSSALGTAPSSDTSQLGAGWYVYKLNSSGGTNYTSNGTGISMSINVSKSNTPLSLTGSNVTYGTAVNIQATESNSVDTDVTYILHKNGTVVTPPDMSVLGVGLYNYTYYTSGGTNFTSNSTTLWINISKASPILTLTNAGGNVTYPNAVNVAWNESNSGDNDLTYTLQRNGTTIASSPDTSVLGAGTYNYTYFVGAGTNYTANSTTIWVLVSPGGQSISLTGITNSTYPYSVTPVCTGNVTSNLYRNGSSAVNNTAIQLGVASYNWTCNTTLNSNYTFASTSVLQIVSIATPSLSVAPLTSVTYGTSTQTGCERVAGDPSSILTLTRNGTQVNQSSTSPINESAIILGAGVWSYTCTITDTQNYSSGISANNYRTVNQQNANVQVFPSTQSQSYPYTASQYCTSDYGSCNIYRNGIAISNNTNYIGAVGTYNYVANITDTYNYTNYQASSTLSITQASATIYLYLNGSASNTTIPNNTVVNLTAVSSSIDSIYIYSLGTNVGAGTSPLTVEVSYSGSSDDSVNVTASLGSNYTTNISTHYVNLDVTYPIISSIQPENTTYGYTVPISVVASENATIKYSINGTANVTLCTSCTSATSSVTMENAAHNITFYWNDTVNFNSTTVYFTVNGIYPIITINNPKSEVYSSITVPINITMNENCTLKYSLNSGENITLCENCSEYGNSSYQTIPNLTDSTVYTMRFYANDSGGHSGTTFVVFSISVPITTPPSSTGGGSTIQNVIGNATTFSISPSKGYTISITQGETKIITGIGRSTSFSLTNNGPDTIRLKLFFTGNESSWAKFLYPSEINGTLEDVIFLDISSGESKDVIAQVNVPLNETTGKEIKLQFNAQDTRTQASNYAPVVVVVQKSWWGPIWAVLMKSFQTTQVSIPGKYPISFPFPWRMALAFIVGIIIFPKVLDSIRRLQDKRATKSLITLILIGIILFAG